MLGVNLQRIVKALRLNVRSSPGFFVRRQSTFKFYDIESKLYRYSDSIATACIVFSFPVLILLARGPDERKKSGILDKDSSNYQTYVLVGDEYATRQVTKLIKWEVGPLKRLFTDIVIVPNHANVDQFQGTNDVKKGVHVFRCISIDNAQTPDLPSNIKEKKIIIVVKYQDENGKFDQCVQRLKKSPEINALSKSHNIWALPCTGTYNETSFFLFISYALFIAAVCLRYGRKDILRHLSKLRKRDQNNL